MSTSFTDLTAVTATRRRRAKARSLAHASMLVAALGAGLLVLTPAREALGRWEQMRLAVRRDAGSHPYLHALRETYAVPKTPGSTAAGAVSKWPPAATSIEGASIRIPTLGVDQAIVAGVTDADLRIGPGHYPGTALPGARGTMVISGHRTTYTRPFGDLDRLESGDPIAIETPERTYRYRVRSVVVVAPSDLSPLRTARGRALVLTTCHPLGSASERLIVVAKLLPAYSYLP